MRQLHRPTSRRAAALAMSLTLVLGACGGGSDSADSTTSTTEIPLDLVVLSLPILTDHGALAEAAAKKGDFDTAINEYAISHDTWRVLRRSLRKIDGDTYDAIEAAQALMLEGAKQQDAARVADAVAAEADAIEMFIKENGT